MTLLLTLAATASALAASPTGHREVDPAVAVIRYADLNLATEAGQRSLRARVAAAERATCQAGPITGSRIATADAECRASFRKAVDGQIRKAIASAERQSGLGGGASRSAGASQR